MIGDWVSIAAFGASFCSTLLIQKIGWVNSIVATELIKRCFISPKTSTCRQLQNGKPLKTMVTERTTLVADIEKQINQDPNVTMLGVHHETIEVLRGMFRQPAAFFLNSMDAIIITKMGVEVLILKFPPSVYDRCIFIDLKDYRNVMMTFSVVSSAIVGLLAAAIVDRKEVRRILSQIGF